MVRDLENHTHDPPGREFDASPRYHLWRAWAHRGMTGMDLTVVFKKVPEGYIAWVEELPGANTQGATFAEAQENILEAIQLTLQANHELTGSPLPAEFSLREKVSLAVA